MKEKIHLENSLKALKEYFDKYNEGKKLKDKLRAHHLFAAERILKIYSKKFSRGEASDFCFETNNESLATTLGCSDDSIIRYEKKLVEAEVIQKLKIPTGTKPKYWFNYTIFINKKFVLFIDAGRNKDVDNNPKHVDNYVENVETYVDKELIVEKSVLLMANCDNFKQMKISNLKNFTSSINRNMKDISSSWNFTRTTRTTRAAVDKVCSKFWEIGQKSFSQFLMVPKIYIQCWNKTGTSLQVSLACIGKLLNDWVVKCSKKNSGGSGKKNPWQVACRGLDYLNILSTDFLESRTPALLSAKAKLLKLDRLKNYSRNSFTII